MIRETFYALDDLYQRYVYERPSGPFRKALVREVARQDFLPAAHRLCRDGMLLLPGYFQGETLRGMQEDFSRWAPAVPPDEIGRITLTERKGYRLRDSSTLSSAAVDPFLLALVAYYWGKPIYLSMTLGFRLEPSPRGRNAGPFQWHHDANRKQIKIYLLLTPVGSEGQRLDYIPGTHTLWHRFPRGSSGYSETRIPDEIALRHGEPVRCAGPAGTAIIMDTNGIHTGNQNMSARRDAWVFQYTAGRHIEPLAGLHPDVYTRLTPLHRMILRPRNLAPAGQSLPQLSPL